ncbi:hypothetical protein F2Q70_00042939 [Brassica cretica]|uniref:Uncharacterized protein n=1 Tax=Brassica cretica TaxID=69181 RepID=A0A8S9KIU9_BRACR|nr:hypothetical protein F2Q70_00042939 [Brassica cretica]
MASRRSNPRDSDRVRTQTGSVNAERIQSGDVSEALTKVLREETRLPRASTQEAKDPEGARPLKKAKTNGSDHRLSVLDPDSAAHMAMEANNEFTATLEKHLQDVPRSDKLYEINKAVSLEARLRVVSNERKSTLEQVSFLEAKVESSANKFSDDLRRATYDAKKALADSYLDVLGKVGEEEGRN